MIRKLKNGNTEHSIGVDMPLKGEQCYLTKIKGRGSRGYCLHIPHSLARRWKADFDKFYKRLCVRLDQKL